MRGRWARGLAFLVALVGAGAILTLSIAWLSATLVDLSGTTASGNGHAYDGHVQWDYAVGTGPAAVRFLSRRSTALAWCVDQACGPPNSPYLRDDPGAWASDPADAAAEWLELDYAVAMQPAAIQIYESFNPGAIVQVTIFDEATGEKEVVWRGRPTIVTPPSTRPAPTSEPTMQVQALVLPIKTSRRTKRVLLDLNSAVVPGWNEIDAVGLVDSTGTTRWATGARASTTYPGGKAGDAVPPGIPYWLIRDPAPPPMPRGTTPPDYVIEGRGWPMFALRAESGDLKKPAQMVRLIYPGFILDTLFFAFTLMSIWWLATYPGKFIRESARIRRGCCLRCGYDLRDGCPECGWRRVE